MLSIKMRKANEVILVTLVLILLLTGCVISNQTSLDMSTKKIFRINVDMFLRRTDAITYWPPETKTPTPINLNDGYGGNRFPPYELVMPYALVDSNLIPAGIPIGLDDGPTIEEWKKNPDKYPATVKAVPAGTMFYVNSIYTKRGYSWWSGDFFIFQHLLCTIDGVENIDIGDFVKRDKGRIILPVQLMDIFSPYVKEIPDSSQEQAVRGQI